ncbi:MAG: hypothetical protein AAF611_18305 [Bacteroidota bacterium]
MKKIIPLVFVLLLTSCVTSNIRSNKSPDFNEKITKLFVIGKVADNSKFFYGSLATNFVASLKDRGVEVRTYYIDPLSLEPEEDITKRIKLYNPNLIMMISQTESRVQSDGFGFVGVASGGTFDVKIFKPNSKNPSWRANLKIDTAANLENAAKKANQTLVEKLIEDGLL